MTSQRPLSHSRLRHAPASRTTTHPHFTSKQPPPDPPRHRPRRTSKPPVATVAARLRWAGHQQDRGSARWLSRGDYRFRAGCLPVSAGGAGTRLDQIALSSAPAQRLARPPDVPHPPSRPDSCLGGPEGLHVVGCLREAGPRGICLPWLTRLAVGQAVGVLEFPAGTVAQSRRRGWWGAAWRASRRVAAGADEAGRAGPAGARAPQPLRPRRLPAGCRRDPPAKSSWLPTGSWSAGCWS